MKKKTTSVPIIMISLGSLLILSVAIWLLLGTPASPSSQAIDASIPYPNINRVTIEDAYDAFTAGSAVFLDVRIAEDYASSRIPGAINIPLGELGQRLGELPQGVWIITYCT